MNMIKMIQVMDHMKKDLHIEKDANVEAVKNFLVHLYCITELYEVDCINLFKEFLLTGVLDMPKYMKNI